MLRLITTIAKRVNKYELEEKQGHVEMMKFTT